jgi:tetratricopeptide (TPR) repeat protein
MGVAARMKGDSATAEKNLEDVYMETPSNFTASNQLAQVLVEQNDADKKQRGLEIAINNQAVAQGEGQRRDPARAIEAASTLGWAFYLLNRIPEADQVTQAVINTSVNASPDIWYYRAKLFQYHGKTDEAIQSLKVATESRGFFIHRQDAQELLASLDKGRTSNPAGASEPSTTKTGASSAPATPASTETPAPAASGSNTATPSSNTATPSGGTDKGSK